MLPTSMHYGLGYDGAGNNEALLAPIDAERLATGEWLRADQNAVCSVCGCAYRLHPAVQGALWLRRACDGLVKL